MYGRTLLTVCLGGAFVLLMGIVIRTLVFRWLDRALGFWQMVVAALVSLFVFLFFVEVNVMHPAAYNTRLISWVVVAVYVLLPLAGAMVLRRTEVSSRQERVLSALVPAAQRFAQQGFPAPAHLAMSMSYQHEGLLDLAACEAEAAYLLDARHSTQQKMRVLRRMAQRLNPGRRGNWPFVQATTKRLVETMPDNPVPRAALADMYLRAGQHALARQLLEESRRTSPSPLIESRLDALRLM